MMSIITTFWLKTLWISAIILLLNDDIDSVKQCNMFQALLPVEEAVRNLREEVHVNPDVVLFVLSPLVAYYGVIL